MIKTVAPIVFIPLFLTLFSCANPEMAELGHIFVGRNSPAPPADFYEEEEVNLGQNLLRGFLADKPVYPLREVNRYVQEVGEKMARVAPTKLYGYNITVMNSSTINSFAFPGGQIVLYRGLLEVLKTESQLAAAIAHEMAHIERRAPGRALQRSKSAPNYHALIKRTDGKIDQLGMISDISHNIIAAGYGPDEELKADIESMKYLADAGYDPSAVLELQKILENVTKEQPSSSYGLLQAHPPLSTRITNITEAMRTQKHPPVSSHNEATRYRTKVLDPVGNYREGIRKHYVSAVLAKRVDKGGAPVDPFTSMNWKDNDFFVVVTLRDVDKTPHSLMLYLNYAKEHLTGRTAPTIFTPEKSNWRTHVRVNGLGSAALVNEQLGRWTATILLDTYEVDTLEFEITK
ncbi:MAG: M48 family metalloprotease [Nitrospirota bacterium]|nr:M48 family metalloprotease [Nitrospirota bacterium]